MRWASGAEKRQKRKGFKTERQKEHIQELKEFFLKESGVKELQGGV